MDFEKILQLIHANMNIKANFNLFRFHGMRLCWWHSTMDKLRFSIFCDNDPYNYS